MREFELRQREIATRIENSNREDMPEAKNIRAKQNPENIIPRLDGSGDISIYLALFEKQMLRINIHKVHCITFLLELLSLDFVNNQ